MSSRPPKKPALTLDSSIVQDDIPVEVIQHIFIGSAHAAFNLDSLQNCGITHILNASRLPTTFPKQFTYLSVDIRDRGEANILSCIPVANIFIEAAIEKGNVLVHCFRGKSRSAAFVVAYLMSSCEWSFDEAYKLIKSVRPMVEINEGFECQLRAYQIANYDVYIAQQVMLRSRIRELHNVRNKNLLVIQQKISNQDANSGVSNESSPNLQINSPQKSFIMHTASMDESNNHTNDRFNVESKHDHEESASMITVSPSALTMQTVFSTDSPEKNDVELFSTGLSSGQKRPWGDAKSCEDEIPLPQTTDNFTIMTMDNDSFTTNASNESNNRNRPGLNGFPNGKLTVGRADSYDLSSHGPFSSEGQSRKYLHSSSADVVPETNSMHHPHQHMLKSMSTEFVFNKSLRNDQSEPMILHSKTAGDAAVMDFEGENAYQGENLVPFQRPSLVLGEQETFPFNKPTLDFQLSVSSPQQNQLIGIQKMTLNTAPAAASTYGSGHSNAGNKTRRANHRNRHRNGHNTSTHRGSSASTPDHVDLKSPSCRLSMPGSNSVRIIPQLRGLERQFQCSWCHQNLFSMGNILRITSDLQMTAMTNLYKSEERRYAAIRAEETSCLKQLSSVDGNHLDSSNFSSDVNSQALNTILGSNFKYSHGQQYPSDGTQSRHNIKPQTFNVHPHEEMVVSLSSPNIKFKEHNSPNIAFSNITSKQWSHTHHESINVSIQTTNGFSSINQIEGSENAMDVVVNTPVQDDHPSQTSGFGGGRDSDLDSVDRPSLTEEEFDIHSLMSLPNNGNALPKSIPMPVSQPIGYRNPPLSLKSSRAQSSGARKGFNFEESESKSFSPMKSESRGSEQTNSVESMGFLTKESKTSSHELENGLNEGFLTPRGSPRLLPLLLDTDSNGQNDKESRLQMDGVLQPLSGRRGLKDHPDDGFSDQFSPPKDNGSISILPKLKSSDITTNTNSISSLMTKPFGIIIPQNSNSNSFSEIMTPRLDSKLSSSVTTPPNGRLPSLQNPSNPESTAILNVTSSSRTQQFTLQHFHSTPTRSASLGTPSNSAVISILRNTSSNESASKKGIHHKSVFCRSPYDDSPRVHVPPERIHEGWSPRDRPQSAEKRRWIARINLLRQGNDSKIVKLAEDDDLASQLTFGREKYFYIEYLDWMGPHVLSGEMDSGDICCYGCHRTVGDWIWKPSHRLTLEGKMETPLFRIHKNVVQEADMPLDVTPCPTPRADEMLDLSSNSNGNRIRTISGDESFYNANTFNNSASIVLSPRWKDG